MAMEQKLDEWQKEVMETEGNMCLRSGRQVGKSFVIGIKAARYALDHPNKLVMVISKTERQAGLLFAKILRSVHDMDKKQILSGKDRPTRHLISLKNGARIHCLPAGDTGYGIMGFTIDLLIADEAAWIPEEVWNSIIPALAITRGNIWLLSTPFVKEGYYYSCFNDPTFTAFHTSSEDCPRKDQIFLDRQKEILTKAQYTQMYLGEFVDDVLRFFSEELIAKCCTLKRRPQIRRNRDYYIGCDVGRLKDKFTYEIIDGTERDHLEQVENLWNVETPLTESVRKIILMNDQYNFKAELIDSGGMGISVCDMLREDDNNKRKVVEVNNAARPYNRDGGTKKILKDELYCNLKLLMELGKIKLLKDSDVVESLRSIQRDFSTETGKSKITGRESHVVEGLIRAAHGVKNKTLNIYIY